MTTGFQPSSPETNSAIPQPPTAALQHRLRQVRNLSEAFIAGLEPEDLCLQGMADASPAKWHLGHTSWFFEEFLLSGIEGYTPADSRWRYLFNSYYEAVGERHPRPQRGLLTRPTIAEVLRWRRQVSSALERWGEQLDPALLELGLQHEQQHQELLLMDLLDGFSRNPLEPAAYPSAGGGLQPEERYEQAAAAAPADLSWRQVAGGLVEIGVPPAAGGPESPSGAFHFDNEAPRHRLWLEPFAIAERLVSNGEYAAFIADGGYRRPELWMSEGWAVVQQRGWSAPRYWRGDWEFSLAGRQLRQPQAPVRHLSWFEADEIGRAHV